MSDNQKSPEEREYKELPPALKSYFRLKNALKGPTLGRDEQGLLPMRFSKTYFQDTCPYCETTAEHEGKKHRYSKVTRKKLAINLLLMFIVGVGTGTGLLNIFVGIAVIGVLGYSMSTHAERKMYYTLLCRKCGLEFPMNKEEQDAVRQEEAKKKSAAQEMPLNEEEEESNLEEVEINNAETEE